MNKRLLALLVAMLMIVVSVGAMAEDLQPATHPGQGGGSTSATGQDTASIELVKTYTGENKPGQTFKFAVVKETGPNGADVPDITLSNSGEITIGADETSGSLTINLPEPTETTVPGEYHYTIREESGTTAGVTYDGTVYDLTVTYYYSENGDMIRAASLKKQGDSGIKYTQAGFENAYTATTQDNGLLTVKKEIAGNGADARDTFEITVTIPKTNGSVNLGVAPISSDGGAVTEDLNNYVVTFKLQGGESGSVYNLPNGWRYEVAESGVTDGKVTGDVSGYEYTSSIEESSGTVSLNTPSTVTVINTFDLTIDTGVNTDVLPYVMLMAIVAAGAVIFLMKRRAIHE